MYNKDKVKEVHIMGLIMGVLLNTHPTGATPTESTHRDLKDRRKRHGIGLEPENVIGSTYTDTLRYSMDPRV
jgi:hypothetical protein